MLVTHRGLSGPSMLQISSYWTPGDALSVDLLPGRNVREDLYALRKQTPQSTLAQYLMQHLPNRFAQAFTDINEWTGPLQSYKNSDLDAASDTLSRWQIKPSGTEGYRTAEVTLGGVDTRQLSSQTMAVLDRPNLFFIGEVVDVTGHLGGHNFQWAWASGVAAGNDA
jgi:predicted Rossmann fold flavoprotein